MKAKEDRRYVIYSRKSRFTGKGESIENQIEICRRYIAAHYGEREAEQALVYEDEGFSGGNLERPKFKRMMSDSMEIEFAAIVVYRLDRISRNIGDFAKLIEDLGNRNVGFVSVREQFDTSSPMGRAMMYIASVFSQLERETIAERIRDNMHELARTGRWLGGNTPMGYESEGVVSVTVDGRARKAYRLKAIPEELDLIKLIYKKFAETASLTKTDEFLISGHYRTRRGKPFSRFAVKAILSNPVYMIADGEAYSYLTEHKAELFSGRDDFDGIHGIMAYNRTLQRPGKATREKPMNEWIVAVGRHCGAISGADWVRVQGLLERNKSKSYRKPRSHIALLSGILRCGHCGGYMRPKLTDRKTPAGEGIYTYLCTTKERSRGRVCNIKSANGNILDEKIIEAVKVLVRQSAELAEQISRAGRYIGGEKHEAELETLGLQIAEAEKNIKALIASLERAEGSHAAEYILAQIEELHSKKEALQKRRTELDERLRQCDLTDAEFDAARRLLASADDCIDLYTVEQKRSAIGNVIHKIVWDGEDVQIYLLPCGRERDFPVSDGVPLCEDSE